jgi:hypothetical protein
MVTYSVTLTTSGEKYELTPHYFCGILSSRHLLSVGEDILFSPLLVLQALYDLW